MAQALKKFKLLEKKAEEGPPLPADLVKPQRKKRLDLYEHIASKFESHDEKDARRKRAAEARLMREEERRRKEKEEERRQLEEEQARKKEQEEQEAKRKQEEEEERLRQEAERARLAKEAEENKIKQEGLMTAGKSHRLGSVTAKSLYEQALATKQQAAKPTGSDKKVVTLRKGTINDIRNKIFERKVNKDNDEKSVKNKIKQKPESEKVGEVENQLDQEKVQPQTAAAPELKTEPEIPLSKEELLASKVKDQETEVSPPKVSKRQSFITDFAALEKTYRILGLSREPVIVEDHHPVVKKRHSSEGKIKNKNKVTKGEEANVPTAQKAEKIEKQKVKIEILEKGISEAKKNFFQELINDKKGISEKEPSLNGPKLRKKTTIASAFEEKNKDGSETMKRNSSIREDVRVGSTLFSSFLNKFEPEDKRAEVKAKIAKITADQKEFEKRKKLMEEENRKKREQEELELAIQMQMEEQLKEQELLAREEEIRAEFEQKQVQNEKKNKNPPEKKRKVKKKKTEETTTEEKPQLKVGCLAYSESRSKFERPTQVKETFERIRSAVKVNKLDLNPFLENLKEEDRETKKQKIVTTNKLKKNSFFQNLEKSASRCDPVAKPEVVKEKKKVSTEIKFEKKDCKEKDIIPSGGPSDTKQKVRVSKSIDNSKQAKKDNKNSSTFSLFIDNTKQFFKSSKEKLYKLSNETLHEIDQLTEEMSKKISKPSTMEMQNYLLSHVLFDKSETPNGKIEKEKGKEKQTKEAEFDLYLDKEYKERIEQYCQLLEETKPKKRKQKQIKENVLPAIKLVEINSIKQQLQSQFERPSEKQVLSEDSEMVGSCNVRKVKELFSPEKGSIRNEYLPNRHKTINTGILEKIKSIEQAENERKKREKENEERIKILLEREFKKQSQNVEDPEDNTTENKDETSTEDLKNDIRLCLEDELTNLEEETVELEETEQLLFEQEGADNVDEHFNDNLEHSTQLQEIREEISQRKISASKKKKVLERFKHVFENEETDYVPDNDIKIGTIKEKLEIFLQNSEFEKKKQFEDNVLTGVSEVMNKVKSRLEIKPEETPILYSKKEIQRKKNATALKFETTLQGGDNLDSVISKSEKEWSWKNKSPGELENIYSTKYVEPKDKLSEKPKKHYQDIKYEELLEDIQAVKERMKERNIFRESEDKNKEMSQFIAEMQDYLIEKEESKNDIEDEWEDEKEACEVIVKEPISKAKRASNMTSHALYKDANFQRELALEKERKNLARNSKMVKDLQKKIFEHETSQKKIPDPVLQPLAKTISGIVPRIAELLQPEEISKELMKAPKLLLKNTSLESEEERPAKTLEELKTEQQNKTWSYKEKSIMELQNFIKCNDGIAPESFKQQQKTLQDLDDELDIVTSLIVNDNTDIIVQIREEKEKEFNYFMNEVKTYVNSEIKRDKVEEEFRNEMKSYIDLIETPTEEAKQISFPELHLNRVNKMKKQLLDKNIPEPEENKTVPSIKKLEKRVELLSLHQGDLARSYEKKEVEKTRNNILPIKKIYEYNETDTTPKTSHTRPLPAILKLKSQKSDNMQHLRFQLDNKSKTIHEYLEYVENNEHIASPKIIEIIHNFKVARKEEEKISIYSKFIECTHAFIEQSSRSEEQKIFKENMKAYLDVIEDSDPLLNGTPKLKKHLPCASLISSNNKKAQIEKDSKSIAQGFSTEKNILSPEEKRKEIFAKYGLKERTREPSIESSCSSLDEDEIEEVKNLTDKELCSKFGLPDLYLPEEPKVDPRTAANNSFINLISKIRNTSVSIGSQKESPLLSQRKAPLLRTNKTQNGQPKPGITSQIKEMFEQLPTASSPMISRKLSSTHKDTEDNGTMHNKSEKSISSPKTPRKFPVLQKSSTVSSIGNFFQENLYKTPSPKSIRFPYTDTNKVSERCLAIERSPSTSIEHSSSFAKVKNAFENGVGLNEDSDDESDYESYSQNNRVNLELQAIRKDNRIQNMFRVCRSGSDVGSRSPNPSRALDHSTLLQVAKSKSAITNMFESQGPKITFGGTKPMMQSQSSVKKPEKIKSDPLDSRKWVFDTIQKYFDVIVEEEQEVESNIGVAVYEEDKEDDNDDDSGSDYTSAEEEIPTQSAAPFSPKLTVSNKFDIQSYFKKEPERRSSSVTGQPIRKVSIDEFVADAAKKFDELTNDSNLSLESPDLGEPSVKLQHRPLLAASSCQNVNQLTKSGSSSKIRGLLHSVVHGSGSNLNLSVFKSNLQAHLCSRKTAGNTLNLDPGVRDDSSSEFSEYDD